jgi:CBS domain-containing protein
MALWSVSMPARLTSVEQLMPFPTAAELIAEKSLKGVISVAPGTTVLAALQIMADKHIGFLPVVENGVLAGVLSERDCARKVVLRQLPVASTAVSTIMSTPVHSVPPEAKIPECIVLMHDKHVRHVPVMRGNEIIGVLSVRDFMAALIARHERLLRRLQEDRLTLLYPDPSSY